MLNLDFNEIIQWALTVQLWKMQYNDVVYSSVSITAHSLVPTIIYLIVVEMCVLFSEASL